MLAGLAADEADDHDNNGRRGPRRDEELRRRRRGTSPGRGDGRLRGGHFLRGHGAVRFGQVDAAALRGRPGPPRQRAGAAGRSGDQPAARAAAHRGAAPASRVRIPVVQPDGFAVGLAQRAASAAPGRHAAGQGLGARGHAAGRSRRPGERPAGPALRRPAAAGRAGPGAGGPSGGHLRGRADRGARPVERARSPGSSAGSRRRFRHSGRHGHARPGGRRLDRRATPSSRPWTTHPH